MKEFLSRHNVDYTERDIHRDASAIEDLRRMNAMMTPVTVIDGQPVMGFDEGRLRQMLGVDQQRAKAA